MGARRDHDWGDNREEPCPLKLAGCHVKAMSKFRTRMDVDIFKKHAKEVQSFPSPSLILPTWLGWLIAYTYRSKKEKKLSSYAVAETQALPRRHDSPQNRTPARPWSRRQPRPPHQQTRTHHHCCCYYCYCRRCHHFLLRLCRWRLRRRGGRCRCCRSNLVPLLCQCVVTCAAAAVARPSILLLS